MALKVKNVTLLFRYNTNFISCTTVKYSSNPPEQSKDEIKKRNLSKTPLGKLDEIKKHPYAEKEPLPEFKDGVNPETGEIGGPRGPEPTRYGDWERKGRVTDF